MNTKLTVKESAPVAKMSRHSLLRWIRLGELPATVERSAALSGGISYYIELSDLIEFCKRQPELSKPGRPPLGKSRTHPRSPIPPTVPSPFIAARKAESAAPD
jgi:hypothetical protein